MDGTAIMQVIAAMFVAVSSGYKVTFMLKDEFGGFAVHLLQK